ncbi:MAG: MFS transporter [Candidatus Rokubacteria bacterium]|nr:MFS transporter [Candidatus Rokubacteria bacterium]MBI4593385.1 MFS transporter [Candidatus Rokubacteria bacterium]
MTRVDSWLLALCASRTFMTFTSMTYAATLPILRGAWEMSATAAGSISTGFHLGSAVSLLFCSWLADRVGARRVYLWSAGLATVAALAFAFFARSYLSGLVLYTLVAVSQGGTYTTGIMLIADRHPPARRGGAMGWFLASSSLGYTFSLLLAGVAVRIGGYPAAFFATACGPLVGGVLGLLALWSTADVIHARPQGERFGPAVLRNGPAMRLMLGYIFHSWELVGMWAWTPAFLAAALIVSGVGGTSAVAQGAYLTAAFHVMGLVASSMTGRLSDRLGRRDVLVGVAAISTICSFVFGWLIGWPAAVIFLVGALYSFMAFGDSPVLTTAFTEAVSPAYLGSALAIRSLFGFGAGAIAPLAFGVVLDLTNPPGLRPTHWGWAFVTLGLGGLGATLCAWGLKPGRR